MDFQTTQQDKYNLAINLRKMLTRREIDCVILLLESFTAKEIAEKLALSPRTVERHLEHVKTKLKCSNKTELVIKLLELYSY